jgi:hypothetical protein
MLCRMLKTSQRQVSLISGMPSRNFVILPEAISPQIPDPFFKKLTPAEKKERLFHASKLISGILAKKLDVITIEDTLLKKQKIVLEPLRVRHALDSFDFMRANKEVGCTIKARDDLPTIDLVLHQQQVRTLKRIKNFDTHPIYVKYENEEIRCTIDKILLSPDKQFYFKVYLNRYIVGQPNLIKVEMFMHPKFHHRLHDTTVEWVKSEVELLSYNDVYPTKMEIDFLRLMRNGQFTFGDLANMLPKGLELSPRYKNLAHAVVKLVDYGSKRDEDVKHIIKLHEPRMDDVRSGEDGVIDIKTMDADTIFELSMKKKRAEAAVDKKPKKPIVSFKQVRKEEQDRLKQQLTERLRGQGLQENKDSAPGKKR